MAAGFRSPLPLLGLGAGAAPTTTAGVRSMLAPWIGGAGVAPSGTTAGVRSMLAPWIGGAGVAPTTDAGVRSLLAFWVGGAGVSVTPEPEAIPTGGGDSARRYLRNRSQFANRKRRPEERTEPQAIPLRPVDAAQTAQALADFTARQMQRAGLDKARSARPAALQMPAAAADAQGANALLLAAMIALLEDED